MAALITLLAIVVIVVLFVAALIVTDLVWHATSSLATTADHVLGDELDEESDR